MTEKKRIGPGEGRDLIAAGEALVQRKELVSEFPLFATSLRLRIAYTPHQDYQAEVARVERAYYEELPQVVQAAADAKTHAVAMEIQAEVIKRLDEKEKRKANDAATVAALASKVVSLYDPAISTPDDPAALAKDLIALGVPLPPDIDPATEIATPAETVAVIMGCSAQLRRAMGLYLFNLSAFYQQKKKDEEGNSEPSQSGSGPVAGTATGAKKPASKKSGKKNSGGSTNPTAAGSLKRRKRTG